MRQIRISFLFFYFKLFFLSCLLSNTIIGQENTNKSILYHNAIWNPQEHDVSIDSAIYFFEKLSDEYLQKNDTALAINALRSVTQGYLRKGALFESELSTVKTLELLDKMPSDSMVNVAKKELRISLGILYRKINDFDGAAKQYKMVLQLSETSKDSIKALNNLANIYSDIQEYQLAVDILNQAYNIAKTQKEYNYQWRIIDNLGYNESKLGVSGALERMNEALKMSLEMNDQESVFSIYRHLIYYYMDRNNNTKALEYASKALKIANSLNLTSFKLESLRLKALSNRDSNVREFVRLSDSIAMANNLNTNKYISKKYAYEEQEKIANEAKLKLKNSRLENERQKNINLIYLLIGLSILLLSVFTYFFLKSKHKKDKIKEAYRKETELSKKVHDELANDMSDLMNFVENDIEVAPIKKSLLLDNIEDIYVRTRDISTETGSINLVNFSESIQHLLMQHNKRKTKVVTNNISIIDWQNIEDHKKLVVYRCLQELLINMKKHSKAKVVSVIFKNHNKKKEIRYVDDGIGFSANGTKLNGLANVESRINGIGGSFNFTTSKGNGFKATLEFNS